MGKGFYSAIIALTAIVLAIAIIVTANQGMALEESALYSKAVISVKAQWQNARFVLDKAASDAIADSVLANGCVFNPTQARDRMNNYFTGILGEMWGNECNLTELELSGTASNIQINATIECAKYFGEKFNVSYKKSAVFNKAVTASSSPCSITVTDLQSGVEEVTYAA
jgi:hypothetical protein